MSDKNLAPQQKQHLEQHGFVIETSNEVPAALLGQFSTFSDSPEDGVLETAPDNQTVEFKQEDAPHEAREESQDDEEHSEQEEAAEEEPRPRKRYAQTKDNRSTEKQRINAATRKLKETEANAYQLYKTTEEQSRRIRELESLTLDLQEKKLGVEKQQVLLALQNAEDEGDSATKAKAADLLADYHSQLREIAKSKQQVQYENSRQYVAEKTQSRQQQAAPDYYAQKNFEDWARQNPWIDHKSNNFDQELYEEADGYSRDLERSYKMNGRGDEVGSPEFYNQISDYIYDTYDLPAPPPKKDKTVLQMKQPRSVAAAPVNRSATMSQPTNNVKSYKDIVLSPEEKMIARGSIGIELYSRDGKPRRIGSEQDAYDHYKQQVYNIRHSK